MNIIGAPPFTGIITGGINIFTKVSNGRAAIDLLFKINPVIIHERRFFWQIIISYIICIIVYAKVTARRIYC